MLAGDEQRIAPVANRCIGATFFPSGFSLEWGYGIPTLLAMALRIFPDPSGGSRRRGSSETPRPRTGSNSVATPGRGWRAEPGAGEGGNSTYGPPGPAGVCGGTMNVDDSTALRAAVEDAMALFRTNTSRFRAALSPVIDSLEALCASLQRAIADAEPADGHAAVLVVTRDLITTVLRDVAADSGRDNRAVMLALATLHNRIVAALDACTVARA